MHLTQTLRATPIFRFWKDFGAGLKKRQPNYKHWRHQWLSRVNRAKIPDYTIPKEMLPPNSRIMEAEELLEGHIDAMPEELMQRKNENIVFDHPWPYNAKLDPMDTQELMYCYSIDTRFYVPRDDCLVLTNTILESDSLQAQPPLEPSGENMLYLERQVKWATGGDSVLVRLPKRKEFPKINRSVRRKYGLTKGRQESNIMNTLANYAQMLLTQHYHEQGDQTKLDDILNLRSLSYPHCHVPVEREPGKKINMELFIDSMLIGKKPLPQIDAEPTRTKQIEPLNIKPRTWRSLLEQSRYYTQSWSFTLPRNANLHTIHLISQIKRDHLNPDEMLARSVVHAFGVASQFARLRALAKSEGEQPIGNTGSGSTTTTDYQASCTLLDPLNVPQVHDKDILDEPVVLQAISYDNERRQFDFLRYQLNTLKFNDHLPDRIKNQAWYSGPVTSLDEALRYYLDFQTFDSSTLKRMRSTEDETKQAVAGVGGSGATASGESSP